MEQPMIRRMTTEDAKAIAELEQRCFSQPWSEASIREAEQNPDYVIFVCTMEEHLLGYCGLLCMVPEGEIVFVCTEETVRRQGIAGLLLKACLAEGRTRGVTDVFLEVREGNAPARRLYQSLGFTETGLRKNYYEKPREHAVLMHAAL